MSIKRLANRLILGVLSLVPRPVAAHVMKLLRQEPSVPDAWGYHVREIHYYEPIPDYRSMTEASVGVRREPSFKVDIDAQSRLARDLGDRFGGELAAIGVAKEFDFDNQYFAGLDASVYYALLRHLTPRRVIEVGGGYSSRIAAKALNANARGGSQGSLTVIEPYPSDRLTEAKIPMELIAEPVESVSPSTFDSLGRNDVLFIDSSHVIRYGNDVFYLFLEILPRLAPGVWIHVHDVFFPYDYPAEWLVRRRYAFNEQYFLEAFLAFNEHFSPRMANFWLASERPESVRGLFASTQAETAAPPASFWMSRE